jgi:hypothetical protein
MSSVASKASNRLLYITTKISFCFSSAPAASVPWNCLVHAVRAVSAVSVVPAVKGALVGDVCFSIFMCAQSYS